MMFVRSVILSSVLLSSYASAGEPEERRFGVMDIGIEYFCPQCYPIKDITDPASFKPIVFNNIQEWQEHLKAHRQEMQSLIDKKSKAK